MCKNAILKVSERNLVKKCKILNVKCNKLANLTNTPAKYIMDCSPLSNMSTELHLLPKMHTFLNNDC